MTTQELRSYIDRILGNSLRVLLPSYWWKRLFGMVVDKVEKAESSITSLTRKINETNNRIDDVESAKQGSSVVVVEWNNMESTTTANNKEAYTLIRHCLENNKPVAVVVWNTIQGLANPHYVVKSFNIRNELDGTVAVWIRFISESTEDHSKYLVFKLTEDGTLKLNKVENIYDDFMSSVSSNAVQNKIVTDYINRQIIFIDADDTTERNEQAFKLIADAYQEGRKPIVYAVNGHFLYIADSIYLSHPSGWEYHRLEFHAWTDTHYHADYTDYRYRFINLYADGKATSSEARVIAVAHEASDTFDEFPLSSKAVKAYVDNSIASAITNTLNTPV